MDAVAETERRPEHVQVLLRVTAALSSAVTGAEVAEVVLTEGASALGAATGAIWRIDAGMLALVASRGYADETRVLVARLPLEPWVPVADAASRGASVWIPTRTDYLARYPRSATRISSQLDRSTEAAVACVPLVRDGVVTGVIAFSFEHARRFDADERALIELLGLHCAQGLERARLYDVERIARRKAEEGRERASFLAKASALLASSLDYETTLGNVARLAVPRMADWCVVEMADRDGVAMPVAIAHVDPAKIEMARTLRVRYPPDRAQGVYEVLRTGTSRLVPEITDEMLVASARGDAERLRLTRELSLRSSMTVAIPSRGRERALGAITFVGAESGRTYGPEDLEMGELLGERAGLAIASAQLFQGEQRARDHLARLLEATAAFAAARTLADVGHVAIDLAGKVVGADRVLVWRHDPGDAELELIAHSGVPDEVLESARHTAYDSDAVVAVVARTRTSYFTDASFVPTAGVVAGSAIALVVQDRLVGALGLAFHGPRGFDPDERAFLRSIADQCAQALDRVRLYDEAIKAVQARDDFLSIAGHELRTPLTALHLQLGSLIALARQDDGASRLAERAGKALGQAERLGRLIDELLDVSRVAQGQLRLDVEEVELGELVVEIVARLEGEFRRAGVAPRLDLHAARGRWDRGRIDQVITNLLANAVKYGAGKPIEVSVGERDGRATLAVIDHGIGIDRDAQARIFDRFERAVSSRHYGGLGLGLWISRQIVIAHGGAIEVHSEIGAGARFEVHLPVAGPNDGDGDGASP
jgi:signal transduction histidine kinase